MDCAKRQWKLIGGNLALVQVKCCFVNLIVIELKTAVFKFYDILNIEARKD